ncbi:hypothetical protein [Oceaniglobus trochenteri]|uniref:hypothetical protein n=1 Tax=Oceaniglobus trochenteri TaxID=2763260 RepID=UPI001CFF79DF|nr:hypothetical protein [Oceaniglobus trochenteri]
MVGVLNELPSPEMIARLDAMRKRKPVHPDVKAAVARLAMGAAVEHLCPLRSALLTTTTIALA